MKNFFLFLFSAPIFYPLIAILGGIYLQFFSDRSDYLQANLYECSVMKTYRVPPTEYYTGFIVTGTIPGHGAKDFWVTPAEFALAETQGNVSIWLTQSQIDQGTSLSVKRLEVLQFWYKFGGLILGGIAAFIAWACATLGVTKALFYKHFPKIQQLA